MLHRSIQCSYQSPRIVVISSRFLCCESVRTSKQSFQEQCSVLQKLLEKLKFSKFASDPVLKNILFVLDDFATWSIQCMLSVFDFQQQTSIASLNQQKLRN
jgi:hypothetical protein